jgi:hypothetical protein
MYKILTFISILLFINGCAQNSVNLSPIGSHKSLATIVDGTFAIDKDQIKKLDTKIVKVWGYLAYSNTSTCGLKNWYFSLKNSKNISDGNSIHIVTPASYKFKNIYKTIDQMRKEDQKTEVLITGKLHTFLAPTNFSTSLGVEIEVESPKDIEFK